jgi:hypothetical protein
MVQIWKILKFSDGTDLKNVPIKWRYRSEKWSNLVTVQIWNVLQFSDGTDLKNAQI